MSSLGLRSWTRYLAARRSVPLLSALAVLVLCLGMPGSAHATKDCPDPCVKCLAEGGAWVNGSFCMKPLPADMTYLEDMEAEDPVLT